MSYLGMKQLLEAGVHFGHETKRWNPKMKRYIFAERNGIIIIDLQKTLVEREKALDYLRDEVLECLDRGNGHPCDGPDGKRDSLQRRARRR